MRAQARLAKAELPRPVDSMSIFSTLDQQRQGTGLDTSRHIRSLLQASALKCMVTLLTKTKLKQVSL